MPDQSRSAKSQIVFAFLLSIAAVLCNVLFFVRTLPGQRFIPWIALLLAAGSLLLIIIGLRTAFTQCTKKVVPSILAVLSAVLIAFTTFGFVTAHSLPKSTGAPQVGDQLADFTLTDTNGHAVTLSQIFSGQNPPKAVLLVFYRGYW